MKKIIISVIVLGMSGIAYGQVGVNTQSPKTTMDVSAKRDGTGVIVDNTQLIGLQAPRLTRAELTANTATYGTDQRGALAYITDVSGGNATGQRVNITTVGYYYFDGTVWQKLTGSGGSSTTEPWYVQGTTTPASSNSENIYQTGSVAIGTNKAAEGDTANGELPAVLTASGSVRGGYAASSTNPLYPGTKIGFGSLAFGSGAEAGGIYGIALGQLAKAMGDGSQAIGDMASATGLYAMALGNNTQAMGQESMALGFYTEAVAQRETVLGAYNAITNGSNTSIIATDPAFQLGIGSGTGIGRKNAVTILKNGQVGIGINGQDNTAKPTEMLDVGSGNVKVRSLPANAGGATDKVVVVDTGGVLKSVDRSSLSSGGTNSTMYSGRLDSGFSLLDVGLFNSWKTLNFSNAEVGAALTNGQYIVPSDGVYQIGYSVRIGTGLQASLLSDSPKIGLLRTLSGTSTDSILAEREFTGVNLLVANLTITDGTLTGIYRLEAGDKISFGLLQGGISLGLLTSSKASAYIYKISD